MEELRKILEDMGYELAGDPDPDLIKDCDMDSLDLLDFVCRIENTFDVELVDPRDEYYARKQEGKPLRLFEIWEKVNDAKAV